MCSNNFLGVLLTIPCSDQDGLQQHKASGSNFSKVMEGHTNSIYNDNENAVGC